LRRRGAPAHPAASIVSASHGSASQKRSTDDVEEIVAEALELALDDADKAERPVEGHDGGDGGDETHGRRDERLGDAGGDDVEARAPRSVDRDEALHDAPHGAEEPNEGSRRAGRREEGELCFKTRDLAP